ncbi:MAG: hypothetical protein GEU78_03615 [Actinobacteria bacterium]|nr:hypothetical protein [Actinomycetota bacterium]
MFAWICSRNSQMVISSSMAASLNGPCRLKMVCIAKAYVKHSVQNAFTATAMFCGITTSASSRMSSSWNATATVEQSLQLARAQASLV